MKHRGNFDTEENYKGIPIHAALGVHDKVASIIKSKLNAGDHIADLGAGHGALSLRLKDLGFAVTAYDFDYLDWPIKEIECHFCDLNGNLGELSHIESLDAICIVEIIEHLENPKGFLRELIRQAKSDTLIIITTPNPLDTFSSISHFSRGIFNWFSPAHYIGGGHISILPYWLIVEHLTSLGIKAVEVSFEAPFIHPSRLKNWIYLFISKARKWMSKSIDGVEYYEGQTAIVHFRT